MSISTISRVLVVTLALHWVWMNSISHAADENVQKHKLSESQIGEVLFGEKLKKSDTRCKVE